MLFKHTYASQFGEFFNISFLCFSIISVAFSACMSLAGVLQHTNSLPLTVPHCKTMIGRRHFSVAAPRVWNSLPLGLKTNCDSLCGFKTGLKTYLFRQDYN